MTKISKNVILKKALIFENLPNLYALCLMRGTNKQNRSPKGNMWSAIPIALLCLIRNCSEGKQGSDSEGGEVL